MHGEYLFVKTTKQCPWWRHSRWLDEPFSIVLSCRYRSLDQRQLGRPSASRASTWRPLALDDICISVDWNWRGKDGAPRTGDGVDSGHGCRLMRVGGPCVLIRLMVEVEKRGERVEADRG